MKRIIKCSTLFLLLLFIILPITVKATDENDYKLMLIDDTTKAEKYLVKDKTFVYFDLEKAKNNGEKQSVIDQGLRIESISNFYNKNGNDKSLRAISLTMPVWGNYCGPGISGDNFTKEPIDILDEGCRRHDLCYKGAGIGVNCECNAQLVKYIDDNYHKMKGFLISATALAIKAFFSTFGAYGC